MNEENIKVVEQFLDALRRKDLSLAPLAADIVFVDPVAGKGQGADNFRAFLSGFLTAINDVEVRGHICDGNQVATRWKVGTVFGDIEIGEFFRVENGALTEAYGYFDPRPIIG